MRLQYENEYFQIENNVSAINEIFAKINKTLENQDTVFSHLVVDGIEVYDNHEEYIIGHLNEIVMIEIATRNVKEMIWETMESIRSYLQRAIPALTELVDNSYENFSSNSWDGITQLAEGMQWIMQFTEVAKAASQQPSNWGEIETSLQICEMSFKQLLEAVEAKDTILIADILSYEIIPAYTSLEKQLTISLDDEEYLKYVN
ncbi:hypothetical protein [Oceanobacillus picturae]|uniref:hypothetical protein n=1 Tax=Oceanobacillus picturae TaxID=171693 RepID=UPI003636F613